MNSLINSSFGSVSEDDLFNALEKAARADNTLNARHTVRNIFLPWLKQTGYPLLTIERNNETGMIILKQERYTSFLNDTSPSTTWPIPYNYATRRNPNFNGTKADGWLTQNMITITLPLLPSEWVIFNKQQTSFYRVMYDDKNWRLIAEQLNSDNYDVIDVLNRAQILDDLNEFVSAEKVNVTIFLDALLYLHRETEYAPWAAAQPGLLRLNRILSGNWHYSLLRAMIANLTATYFESLGLEDVPEESILQKYSREIATNLACEFALESCLLATHAKLSAILQSEIIKFPLNTKSIIISNGIRVATRDELEVLWKLFLTSNDLQERKLIIKSFGHIDSYVLLREYLNRTLAEAPIDHTGESWRQNLFRSVLRNGEHGVRCCLQLLWNYALEVWEAYKLDNLNELVIDLSNMVYSVVIQKEVGY